MNIPGPRDRYFAVFWAFVIAIIIFVSALTYNGVHVQ